jgi:hypothetical protein
MLKKHLILIVITAVTVLALGCIWLFGFTKKTWVGFIALDNENLPELPKNFRVMSNPTVLGVSSSASGQISEHSLQAVLHYIKQQRTDQIKIWIIDLRQESHGFINGFPITWYADRNEGNQGKTASEILYDEHHLLKAIKLDKPLAVFKIVKGLHGEVSPGEKYILIPQRVETEEQLIKRYNLNYLRLFTMDHDKPNNSDVDHFIEFVQQQVAPQDWLHFHCRGGRGRTSTYLTLLFIMFNAKHMSLEDILLYQQEIGSIDLAKVYNEEGKLWKNDLANFRYEFIKDFYRFAQDPQGLGWQTWSQWSSQNTTISTNDKN